MLDTDTDPGAPELHQLLEVLDSAEEAAGWGGPAQLVGVTGRQLSYVAFPAHPLEKLLGWTALPIWSAIAVIAEGWAAVDENADFQRNTFSKRPSRTFGRERVRAITIMGRDGFETSGLRYKGGEFKVMPGPYTGTINDAMRRSLDRPTPAPEFPVVELFAQRWLASLVSSAKRGKHQPKVSAARTEFDIADDLVTLGHAEGWELLRDMTARGRVPTNVSPELAAWMDAGIFARFTIGELPPLSTLVKQARRRTDAEGRRRIEARLRWWNLHPQPASVDAPA